MKKEMKNEINLLNERLQIAHDRIDALKAHIRSLEDNDKESAYSDGCPKCGGKWITDRDIFLNIRIRCQWCGYNPRKY